MNIDYQQTWGIWDSPYVQYVHPGLLTFFIIHRGFVSKSSAIPKTLSRPLIIKLKFTKYLKEIVFCLVLINIFSLIFFSKKMLSPQDITKIVQVIFGLHRNQWVKAVEPFEEKSYSAIISLSLISERRKHQNLLYFQQHMLH